MGSETITVKSISSSNIIPDNYRLYQKTLVNTALNMNKINIKDIHNTLIRGIMYMFNTTMLLNQGLLYPITLLSHQTDSEKIFQYIADNLDGNITELLYWGDEDRDGKSFYCEPTKYINYIQEEGEYEYDINYYIEWSDIYNVRTDYPPQELKIKIGAIIIDDKKYVPKIDSSTNEFVIDRDNNLITLINLDDEADEIQIDYPNITIRYIATFWTANTDYSDETIEYGSACIKRDDATTLYSHNVFVLPLKLLQHGNFDDYKFILNKYNLRKDLIRDDPDEDDLYDTYNNDDYTNILFGYIARDGYLEDYIETFYGKSYDRYDVSIEVPDRYSSNKLVIEYYKENMYYKMKLYTLFGDGQEHSEDDGYFGDLPLYMFERNDMPFFIVPYDITIGRSLKFKYDFFEKTFSILLSISQEKKLKWYQTTWFRIILIIVSFVLTAITFGIATAFTGMVMSFVGQALSALNKNLGLLFAIVTFVYNAGGSLQNLFSNPIAILNTVNFLAQNVAKYNIENKIDELNNLKEEEKKALKEYNKTKGLDIKYTPFDELHKMNDILTDPLNATWNSVKLGTVKLGY